MASFVARSELSFGVCFTQADRVGYIPRSAAVGTSYYQQIDPAQEFGSSGVVSYVCHSDFPDWALADVGRNRRLESGSRNGWHLPSEP